MDQICIWVGFNVLVLAMLALDLGVFHKEAHEVSIKEAAAHDPVVHDPLERRPPDPVYAPIEDGLLEAEHPRDGDRDV